MTNPYQKICQYLKKLFENKCNNIDDMQLYKDLCKKLKSNWDNVIINNTPAGIILLSKSEACPEGITKALSDYNKLLKLTQSNNLASGLTQSFDNNGVVFGGVTIETTSRPAPPEKINHSRSLSTTQIGTASFIPDPKNRK